MLNFNELLSFERQNSRSYLWETEGTETHWPPHMHSSCARHALLCNLLINEHVPHALFVTESRQGDSEHRLDSQTCFLLMSHFVRTGCLVTKPLPIMIGILLL